MTAPRLYRRNGDYYLRNAGNASSVRWVESDGSWLAEFAEIPDDATEVAPETLPPDLLEEILAFNAQAEVMGGSGWRHSN